MIVKMAVLFLIKVADNALATAKTILIQKNKSFLAGLALAASNFLYLKLTKDIVMMDGDLALYIVALASGIGCWMAIWFDNHFSKDKIWVNVIMCDDKNEIKRLGDFLVENKITNVVTDSYTRDLSGKTLTITAYAETKHQSELIDEYINKSNVRFKRVIEKIS